MNSVKLMQFLTPNSHIINSVKLIQSVTQIHIINSVKLIQSLTPN